MNSSKPQWLDRQLCSYERSENRGRPVRDCEIRGILQFINGKGWTLTHYRCRECKCIFKEKGRQFPIPKKFNPAIMPQTKEVV